MNAIMSPTRIAPAATPCEPNHTMATVAIFMTSIMIGIMSVIARFTNSCASRSSPDASSKRPSSWSCRPNARMVMRPSSISRVTRFTRSTSDCIALKRGIVSEKSTLTTPSTASSAAPTIQASPPPIVMTCTTATTPMTGANMTMRSMITIMFWICCTSLVQRVMSDDCENRLTSAGEKDSTFANTSRRRSRATAAATRDAMRPESVAAASDPTQKPSITSAMCPR